jgi:predicted RNA-binding Zn-ribbon protein involved in translation (DUF1610 family)
MSPIIQFKCRTCDAEISTPPEDATEVVCPSCKKEQPVRIPATLRESRNIQTCISCGHSDFYVQKDFNRRLGVVIVAIGVLASTYFFERRQPFYAMASLVVTALIDLVIYSVVGLVSVCYSCHAVYRGFNRNPEHEAFDLKKLEKYGGRSPRW